MSQFQGTWIHDGAKMGWDGFDEFMDHMGLKEAKDTFRNSVTTMTYEVKGNTWTVTSKNSAYEKVTKHVMEVGKEFTDQALNGSDVKVVLTVISDSEIKEAENNNMEDGEWRDYEISRKVDGDIMHVKITSKGKSMSHKMTREKTVK